MADQGQQRSNTDQQFKCDNDNATSKPNTNSDSTKAPKKPPASISTIYYDCLERIFEFLDLRSLLNLACTSKRLQIAAAAKFGEDYVGRRILMGVASSHTNRFYSKNKIKLTVNEHEICVHGLKLCLPFLRCFGTKITNLHISNMRNDPHIGHMYRYVNEYCADSLTRISFRGDHITWKNYAEHFSKTFKNVVQLDVASIILGKQLPNFVNLFPNVRALTFQSVHYVDNESIAVHFPHLVDLNIPIGPNGFTIENAMKLVHANPQVKHLELNTVDDNQAVPVVRLLNRMNENSQEISMDQFLNVINGCQSLLKLKTSLACTDVNANNNELLEQLAKKHKALIELDLEKFKFNHQSASLLIGQLNSMKRFQLSLKDFYDHFRLLQQLNGQWQHVSRFFPGINTTLTR